MPRECGSLKKQRFLKPTPFWCFQPWRPQKRVGLRNLLPPVSQTYPTPFWKFQPWKPQKRVGLKNSALVGFEPRTRWPRPTPDLLGNGPKLKWKAAFLNKMPRECGSLKKHRFLKPTPFWCFQPWKPQKRVGLRNWWEKISQTYPFLKVSALKTSKRVGLRNSASVGFEPCTRWPGPTPDPLGNGAQTQMKGRLFEENAPEKICKHSFWEVYLCTYICVYMWIYIPM